MIKTAIFPVAGLGTRFLPATKATPKEMLPIVDKPLIQYAVEEAITAGITNLIFVTSSTKRPIEDHFDSNFELEYKLENKNKLDLLNKVKNIIPENVSCVYIRQKEALGLGHAVLQAKNIIGNNAFAVLLADDLLKTNKNSSLQKMIAMHNKFPCNIIALEKVDKEKVSSYGVVEVTRKIDNFHEISSIVEKPEVNKAPSNLAVVGRYILQPEIFSILEKVERDKSGEIQLTSAIAEIMQFQKVFGFELIDKRYDCGNKLGFLRAQVDFGLDDIECSELFRSFLCDKLNNKILEESLVL